MIQRLFNIYLQIMAPCINFAVKHQLVLLCVLCGAGLGVYSYGVRRLSRLRKKQLEEMRLHPDDPAPDLPENIRQSALAFEIAGFIILLAGCLGMLVLGHFDRYLALLGIGG